MKFVFIALVLMLLCCAVYGDIRLADNAQWAVYYNNNSRGAYTVENGIFALNYDFSHGDYSAHAGIGVPMPLDNMPSHIRFKLRKTASHRLSLRIIDSKGETFQKQFCVPVCSDWQTVEVSLSGFSGSWGGGETGVFVPPFSGVGFAVEQGMSAENKGRIEIKEVEAVYRDTMPETMSLTAAPFGNMAAAEYYADITGDTYKGDTTVVHSGDLELSGEVQSIRVPVKGNGSVTVRCACHFDTFEMTREAENGIAEFPCGKNMTGWTVDTMEFKGALYEPLRLSQIVYHGTEPNGLPVCSSLVAVSNMITAAPTWEMRGKNAVFTAAVKSLKPKPSTENMKVEIKDYNGITVKTISRRAALTGMGAEDIFRFEVPMGRENLLEAKISFDGDGIYSFAGQSPVVPDKNRCSTSALNINASLLSASTAHDIKASPFGMGVYLYRRKGEAMKQTGRLASAVGVKWSREEFNWGAIELRKGVLDYSHYDEVVNTAKENSIPIYGLLAYWNQNYPADTDEGREAYYHYVRETVLRYKDYIKHWEIWNEPNIGFFQGPKENYYLMLKHCYKMIKEIDPELQVLGCSTSLIDKEFIQKAIDAGCNFDVLTIHPYRTKLEDDEFIRELEEAVEMTKQIDGTPREVWITEMGWPTNIYSGATEREQAEFLVRAYADASSVEHISSISWYNFINDGSNRYYSEHSFGVLWEDLRPKPAYIAFDTMTEVIGSQPVKRQSIIPETVVFSNAEGAVLWSRETGLYSIDGALTLYDLTGRQIEGRGMVWLENGKPVLVKGNIKGMAKIPVNIPAAVKEGMTFVCTAEGCTAVPYRLPEGFEADGRQVKVRRMNTDSSVLCFTVKRGAARCLIYPSVDNLPKVLEY